MGLSGTGFTGTEIARIILDRNNIRRIIKITLYD